jgi:magnesium chelatase family protein
LDEIAEFSPAVLDTLREPLEERSITISRAGGAATYPARFVLIGAMNPCPCGHWGEPDGECRCLPEQVERYRGRLSGPLLDRIDLRVHVPRVAFDCATTSKVLPARSTQSKRPIAVPSE